MKRLLVVFLLIMPATLFAQKEGQELLDSLLKQLSAAKNDTNKVTLESRIAFEYGNVNPDEGITHGMQALALAKELKFNRGLENIYSALGTNCFIKSDFPKGMEYFFLCLKAAEESGRKSDIEIRLYNISSAYFNIGDFSKALEYSSKSLKIAKEIKDTLTIASNLSNMGAIYAEQHNIDTALVYLFKALKLLERRNDNNIKATTLEHISVCEFDKKEYSRALEYGNQALKLYTDIGDMPGVSLSLLNIGGVYLAMAKDSSKIGSPSYATYLGKSITYYERSRIISREAENLDALMDASNGISEAYELSGNYREAGKAYKEYIKLKDSVYSSDNKLKLSRLETQREGQLKEKQIEINKLAEHKKRNERVLFVVGIILLLVVILVVMRNFMIQRKANVIKGELLRQKDVLMKEIHHRVKNNLQVISTLLDLQLTHITDKQAQVAMTESATRIRSISLIHQQLYLDANLNTIEFSKFAKDLLLQVTSVYKKEGQKIELQSKMPETFLDIDTAVPLGLILNELMTNSYKYAFADVNEGSIEIALHRDGNYELTYKDSGPGLPASVNLATHKGLGMRVIRSLSKQIGGTFTYDEQRKSIVITFKDMTGRKLTD